MSFLSNVIVMWQYKPRPNSKDWRQITETEVYKNDNTLRDYQLEGLNWLTFSYYNRFVFYKCTKEFHDFYNYLTN